MSFLVSEVSSSRFPELVRLFNNAFHQDLAMMGDVNSQQAIDVAVSKYELIQQQPGCYYIVLTDTNTETIISFARWRMYPRGYEGEDLSVLDTTETADATKRYEIEFLTKIDRERQRLWKNKPVCFLDILATDPAHQKRGAATLLMKWGIDQADAMGLPAQLEASDSSRGFYERYGFEKEGQITIDLSQYGMEGEEIIAILNRGSKGITEESQIHSV